MTRFAASILFIVCLFSSCNNKPTVPSAATTRSHNTLSSAEQQEGWQLLFDGATTNGWHSYGKEKAGTAWKVADGVLFLDTLQKDDDFQIKEGGDLVTNQTFEDYHLQLEWNIAKGGNSGIIFNLQEDTALYPYTWSTGPEMQVLDKEGDPHGDGKLDKHRAGDLYALLGSRQQAAKGAGEWNKAEIIVNKGRLELKLNGISMVRTTLWTNEWKALISASKFKDMPRFGSFRKGHIALQDHGNRVSFRNIKIKPLQ